MRTADLVKIAIAAALLAAAAPATAKHWAHSSCPAGTHLVRTETSSGCVSNSAPSGGGSSSGDPQSQERKAWADHGAAIQEYNRANGSYSLSQQSASAAQRQLADMNCGQFACDTHEVQGRISSAQAGMSNEQATMSRAIASCRSAASAIEAAHREEASKHVAPVNSSKPSCPNAPGQSTDSCPKGTVRRMDKCVKA